MTIESAAQAAYLVAALLFILVMLVIPAIRTAYLSLFDADSEQYVGLENYTSIFTDSNSLDLANWTNMFTSIPFILGMGIPKLEFATGQDSYLNADEVTYTDNVEYQDLFGGQAQVVRAGLDADR